MCGRTENGDAAWLGWGFLHVRLASRHRTCLYTRRRDNILRPRDRSDKAHTQCSANVGGDYKDGRNKESKIPVEEDIFFLMQQKISERYGMPQWHQMNVVNRPSCSQFIIYLKKRIPWEKVAREKVWCFRIKGVTGKLAQVNSFHSYLHKRVKNLMWNQILLPFVCVLPNFLRRQLLNNAP